jgi:uncharacterized damage-inducible protein DinB
MDNAVREDANVGVLVPRDRLAAAHAAREHRVDGPGHFFDGGIVVAGSDVHWHTMYECAYFCQMKESLLRLVAHMRWADARVADELEDAPSADPEAVRLFAHIASVEHLWYSRIFGGTPAHAVWPALSVAESRRLAGEHAELFERLVDAADAAALDRVVEYRNSAGIDYRSSVSDIVLHTAMHGEHHRGQIARLVRAAGREPPYTDYIQFARRDQ